MTKEQFDKLKIGDDVILAFSEDAKQKVISINGDMVETRPNNSDDHISYNNHYRSIQLPDMIMVERSLLQEIYDIAKDAKHTVEDWSYGDFYPEESEELIFPQRIINALKNLI